MSDLAWTVETLRAHFEAILRERDERYKQENECLMHVIEAQQRELQTALQALSKQIAKAEEMTERRFEGVSTARRVGDDLARQMMPRTEAVQRDAALDEKITAITARMDRNDGRTRGLNAGWAYLVAGIGAVASIATMVYAIARLSAKTIGG